MSKTDLIGTGLLILSLCGCVETKTDNAPAGSGRTGSVGVTTQDIDDLGKPASKSPGGAGGVTP